MLYLRDGTGRPAFSQEAWGHFRGEGVMSEEMLRLGVGLGLILSGFLISLGFGFLGMERAQEFVDEKAGLESRASEIPEWIVGTAERLFFTVAVAFSVPGILPAMVLWLGAKMAANWGARPPARDVRTWRMRALILGVASLTFALLGGLFARWGVSQF